jgi:4-hydroxybenzoate polyprenyltransferase
MGSLSLSPILLYLSGISWTLFYDTIYAHQDKEDDALIGVKSTARLFQSNTKSWLWFFLIISITFITLAFITALKSENNILCFIIGITGILSFGIHLIWQLINLDINNADNCLMIFRSNRNAGLLPVFGFTCAIILQSII